MIPPDDFDPPTGIGEALGADLVRVAAPNPSPMTYRGTNTYIIGSRKCAVIDPGPASDAHLTAILGAVPNGAEISHILVTHTHLDHSPLASKLSAVTGAPVYAFGGPRAGRSAIMQELARSGDIGGGEGIDEAFQPDVTLRDGDVLEGDGWHLEAIHTPGHIGNHLAFAWRYTCFVGDHVMGWASSLVSPPDGDLTDFMASCEKLRHRAWSVFHAGHGAPIESPIERLNWLIEHRLGREAAILDAVSTEPITAADLAAKIYTETPSALLGAATRNVLAHLVDLTGKSLVRPIGSLTADAQFERL